MTADISFALRHYFSITNNFSWLEREGCQLANEIGKFWSNRVELNGNYNNKSSSENHYADDGHDFYEIRGKRNANLFPLALLSIGYILKFEFPDIMGPDEYHGNVSNNIYTNIAAAFALGFGE